MKNKTLLSASLALMMALPMQAQQLKEYAGDAELRIPECKITVPPKSLHLDKFYKKFVDVNGIPIVTSWRVPDSCIVAAHHTLYAMTSMLKPEVLEAMNGKVSLVAPKSQPLKALYLVVMGAPSNHSLDPSSRRFPYEVRVK